MKTNYIALLFFLLTTLLALSGCSDSDEPKPLTYTQLLTGTEKKSWRLTTLRIIDEGSDSGPINIRQVVNSCAADDIYVFYANGIKTYEVQEGATKCSSSDPDVFVSDAWSLVNATATLTFVMPLFTTEFAIPFTIKTLTEDSLIVEFYASDVNLSYRFIFAAVKE